MALTRKMLKGLGIGEDQIDTIIEAHTETVDALKKERDKYKESAEQLPDIKNELDSLKNDGFEKKYNDIKAEYDNYKQAQTEKEAKAAKETAYKELLKSAGVSEKRIGTILKVTDLKEVSLDKDGKIKDSDKVTSKIKEEWADFIVKEGQHGADTKTPPPLGNDGQSKRTGRAKEIAQQYHDSLYGALTSKSTKGE